MSEVEELRGRLEEIAKSLKPNHLNFAIGFAKTGNITQAFIDAGYSKKTAAQNAYLTYHKYPLIKEYVMTSKLIAALTAQVEVEYNEKVWLQDILEARDMALGRKSMSILFFGETKEVISVHLSAFTKISEQLGKKLGLFKETLNVNAKAVVAVIPADADPQTAAQMYQDMIRGS